MCLDRTKHYIKNEDDNILEDYQVHYFGGL